eukprot:scaffold5198_cov173-Amphora_coffeaeformis.AAC.17
MFAIVTLHLMNHSIIICFVGSVVNVKEIVFYGVPESKSVKLFGPNKLQRFSIKPWRSNFLQRQAVLVVWNGGGRSSHDLAVFHRGSKRRSRSSTKAFIIINRCFPFVVTKGETQRLLKTSAFVLPYTHELCLDTFVYDGLDRPTPTRMQMGKIQRATLASVSVTHRWWVCEKFV